MPYRSLLTGVVALTLLGAWAGPAAAAGPAPVLASTKTLAAVVVVLVVVVLAGILVYMIQNREDIDDEDERSTISIEGDTPADFGTAGMYGSAPAHQGSGPGFGAPSSQGFDPSAALGGRPQQGYGPGADTGVAPAQGFGGGQQQQGYGNGQPAYGTAQHGFGNGQPGNGQSGNGQPGYSTGQPGFGAGAGAGAGTRPGFGGGGGGFRQPPGTLDDMLSSVVGSSPQPAAATQRIASSSPLAPSGAVRPAGMPGTTSAAPTSRPALGVGSGGPTVRSPGWYPAAGDPYRQAYWDGSRWTTTIRWNGTAWEQTGAS
jgi:hypothetical protein